MTEAGILAFAKRAEFQAESLVVTLSSWPHWVQRARKLVLIPCGVSSSVSSISFINPSPHAGHLEFSSIICFLQRLLGGLQNFIGSNQIVEYR